MVSVVTEEPTSRHDHTGMHGHGPSPACVALENKPKVTNLLKFDDNMVILSARREYHHCCVVLNKEAEDARDDILLTEAPKYRFAPHILMIIIG